MEQTKIKLKLIKEIKKKKKVKPKDDSLLNLNVNNYN